MSLRDRREIGGLTMRPDRNDVIGARSLHTTEYRQVTTPDNETRVRGGVPPQSSQSSQSPRPPRSGRELRLNEQLKRLLSQKRGPDAVMIGALSVALLCGLIGFAANFMWIVAIVVLALALGFVVADSRRNRIDIANQRAEGKDG
ncbi:hypothetical protein ABH920_004572 [Catenulispora sp. EB89]|uniref:hypothetical protein n=1 Tax=Catenulispora sp. EB89 TaxID=3156257 RepID=UPI0035114B89